MKTLAHRGSFQVTDQPLVSTKALKSCQQLLNCTIIGKFKCNLHINDYLKNSFFSLSENNLQTDESHKRDDTTIAEDETQHRETKPQSLAAQLRSPVLTNSRIPATSKSAFKPVSQRRQSLDSVNLPRRDSFGVSNPRGAMTKELLTAQLKSFLVNDEPPTQVVQGNDQELGKTLTTGTGRKLPPSPDVNQGDILPNQSGAKLGQVPRRPNSTDSRRELFLFQKSQRKEQIPITSDAL